MTKKMVLPSKLGNDILLSLSARQVLQLFDHLPGVSLFVKDRLGRFLRVNRALLDRRRMKDESEILGTTDHDHYPPHLADRIVATDRQVMSSGQPILDHADILYDQSGTLVWFRTTKYPWRDRRGRIMGVMGVTVAHDSRSPLSHGNAAIDRAIDWIRNQTPENLRVGTLAEEVGIPARSLNRLFQHTLGISVQEFLLRSRTQSAASALRETAIPLSAIATDHGFYDQSAFTRQFRKQLGLTPKAYRAKYRSDKPH